MKPITPQVSNSMQSVHVLGGGSLGCLFASALASQGHKVTLVLRDLAPLRAAGDCITLQHGVGGAVDRAMVQGALVSAPSLAGSISNLIVATKAAAVLPALRSVLPSLSRSASLVLLQNGLPAVYEEIQPVLSQHAQAQARCVCVHGLVRARAQARARVSLCVRPGGSPVEADAVCFAVL
jgi:ketopantoate reductase